MNDLVKKTPYAICGLALGMASLATIYKELGYRYSSYILAIISFCFILLVLIKIFEHFSVVKKEFENISVASTAPTLTMTIQLLTTFLLPIEALYPFLQVIWWTAVIFQFLFMIYYVYQFFIKPKKTWEIVYPSWFVTLVGIGVITVTSPNYYLPLGKAMFYLGLVLYLTALPFVLYRVFVYKKLPEKDLPLTSIIAAPGSLLLAGYISAFKVQNGMLFFLLILSQILYFLVLALITKYIRLPFYPTFGGFTFPTVISAKACIATSNYLEKVGYDMKALFYLGRIEFIIATVIVLYVTFRYLQFLTRKTEKVS